MTKTPRCYTVVENAGYEGERDIRTAFSTARAAWNWAHRHYTQEEMDDLYIEVAMDTPEGRTYEY